MSAHPFNVAIIGCGKIAGLQDRPRSSGAVATHAQAFHRNPAFKLSAVVEPDDEVRERYQKRWGVERGYFSLEKLLASETEVLDLICLASPTPLHVPQTEQLLRAQRKPKVLFVEKPVCIDPAECGHLIELAKDADIHVAVNHTRRFDPSYRKLAQTIQSGCFGDLVGGRCTYYGGWVNGGVHLVDTLRMLLDKPLQVNRAQVTPGGRGWDENLDLTLELQGAPIEVEGFDERHYQLFEFDLKFRQGRVQIRDLGTQIILEKTETNALDERVLIPAFSSPWKASDAALANAATLLADTLSGKEGLFEHYGVSLTAAHQTMRLVWEGREKTHLQEKVGEPLHHATER